MRGVLQILESAFCLFGLSLLVSGVVQRLSRLLLLTALTHYLFLQELVDLGILCIQLFCDLLIIYSHNNYRFLCWIEFVGIFVEIEELAILNLGDMLLDPLFRVLLLFQLKFLLLYFLPQTFEDVGVPRSFKNWVRTKK